MRYPASHKHHTHVRIVEAASLGFREHGLAGLSVATVMGELGLTHGGFYAHFTGKDALVVAAAERALDQAWAGLDRIESDDSSATIRAIASAYLSTAHRDGRAQGCVIAALGPELARSSPEVRRAVGRIVAARLRHLSTRMTGRTSRRRRDAATILVATLVGTLLLSRLLPDREGRRALLVARRMIGQVAAGARRSGTAESGAEGSGRPGRGRLASARSRGSRRSGSAS